MNQARTDAATDLAERAARVLPGGSTHMARAYRPAIYVARAQGSRKWLVDGREMVDYTMGHGALLLGHAHPAVVGAVREQLRRGTHYGAASPQEVEWAERIAALVPSARQLRFTASGTEAAMLALRLARVATRRSRIVKLADHFNGWSDAVSVDIDEDGLPHPVPGVPDEVAALTTVVVPEPDVIRAAVADRSAAALILEPTGAHYGRTPLDRAVVQAAREATAQTGTVLIFDEVVSGFRVAPGGMQSLLEVAPDLTLFGKVMAGGLPAGAVGGSPELMGALVSRVAHPGTFNANPLSASAGIATLDIVGTGEAQRVAAAYAEQLVAGWGRSLEASGISGRAWSLASIVHVELDDQAAQSHLADEMRARGVDLLHTSAFCSAVHTPADLEFTIDVFDASIRAAEASASAAGVS